MLISRYIFRQTASALLTILISLTLIVWLTSVLKEIKLLTSEGQTFFLFLKITSLTLPYLVVTVAPIGFLIASLYTYNRLNGDSELIVLSAAGASVWRLFIPYFALAVVVSGSVLATNIYVIPRAARLLSEYVAQVRADLLSQVMQPGSFSDLEPGLTFHMRDKGKEGELLGVVVRDQRDPNMATTVVAERGQVLTEGGHSSMELYDGQILRQEAGKEDVQIVVFKTYAFDIADMAPKQGPHDLSPRERDIGDLLYPDEGSKYYQENKPGFRAEIHGRFSGAVYAIVFAILATVYFGRPRTTREGRSGILLTAFAIGALILLVGIAGLNMVGKNLGALGLIYGVPAAVGTIGLLMLAFNINAPALGMPRLRLPWPLTLVRRRPASSAQTS